MSRGPAELWIDDDGVTIAYAEGSVRVEMERDGWCVYRPSAAPEPCAPTAAGALHAAVEARHAVLGDRRRRSVPRSTSLFCARVEPIDFSVKGACDRLLHVLVTEWLARAKAWRPEAARLFGLRPLDKDLILCGASRFLDHPYLLQDALRFRGARAVIAHCDRFVRWQPDGPPDIETYVTTMSAWRQLLSADSARVLRALHVTLDRGLPDEVPSRYGPEWREENQRWDRYIVALREGPLVRPLESRLHLELLGEYRAKRPPDRRHHDEGDALLQRASAPLLATWLRTAYRERRVADRLALIQWLAHDLGRRPPPAGPEAISRWLDDVTAGHRVWRQNLLDRPVVPKGARVIRRKNATPPIALPSDDGVIFLATPDAMREAGERLHCCLGSLVGKAQRGDAYYFWVNHPAGVAAVEVARDGRVTQAKGPCNEETVVAKEAAERLGRWGLGLLFCSVIGPRHKSRRLRAHPALTTSSTWPSSLTPLTTTAHLLEALRAMPGSVPARARLFRRMWESYVAREGYFAIVEGGVRLVDHTGAARVYLGAGERVRRAPSSLARPPKGRGARAHQSGPGGQGREAPAPAEVLVGSPPREGATCRESPIPSPPSGATG